MLNTRVGMRLKEAGRVAARKGMLPGDNPFPEGTEMRAIWRAGFDEHRALMRKAQAAARKKARRQRERAEAEARRSHAGDAAKKREPRRAAQAPAAQQGPGGDPAAGRDAGGEIRPQAPGVAEP